MPLGIKINYEEDKPTHKAQRDNGQQFHTSSAQCGTDNNNAADDSNAHIRNSGEALMQMFVWASPHKVSDVRQCARLPRNKANGSRFWRHHRFTINCKLSTNQQHN